MTVASAAAELPRKKVTVVAAAAAAPAQAASAPSPPRPLSERSRASRPPEPPVLLASRPPELPSLPSLVRRSQRYTGAVNSSRVPQQRSLVSLSLSASTHNACTSMERLRSFLADARCLY
jgi:hypothetical protein